MSRMYFVFFYVNGSYFSLEMRIKMYSQQKKCRSNKLLKHNMRLERIAHTISVVQYHT